ncbi:MAG: beta-glucosidase [Deltaproteobacteria bacterium]|nr:beta-glucosidase [Deltaproteobacteria bacterium]
MSRFAALAPPFQWGVATSAYQIEGATSADGRGPSIWDTFAEQPGHIEDGSHGRVACDHYHRWQEDLALMEWLGVGAYRFSIAWPRVLPSGTGPINTPGLDFYDRLVDGCLARGITPFATLYHWDLPQALEDRGGWRARETAQAFAAYAEVVARRLGDRVKFWITQNEPWCAAFLGHAHGAHAPGRRDPKEALFVAHHLLLSHGLSTQAIRAAVPGAEIGLAHLYLHAEPASESEADALACRHLDGAFNRWFLDPLYGRGYPEDLLTHYQNLGQLDATAPAFVRPGDLEVIGTRTNFLGLNYYTRGIARSDRVPEANNLPRRIAEAPLEARTDMGWEVYPAGLEAALLRLTRDYAPAALYVTENGAAYADGPDAHGRVHDERRTAYLEAHLLRVAAAKAAGAPVRGYFAWSLLDNFEWAFGYSKRFGLVHVDFQSQRRIPKDSAHGFKAAIGAARKGEAG